MQEKTQLFAIFFQSQFHVVYEKRRFCYFRYCKMTYIACGVLGQKMVFSGVCGVLSLRYRCQNLINQRFFTIFLGGMNFLLYLCTAFKKKESVLITFYKVSTVCTLPSEATEVQKRLFNSRPLRKAFKKI